MASRNNLRQVLLCRTLLFFQPMFSHCCNREIGQDEKVTECVKKRVWRMLSHGSKLLWSTCIFLKIPRFLQLAWLDVTWVMWGVRCCWGCYSFCLWMFHEWISGPAREYREMKQSWVSASLWCCGKLGQGLFKGLPCLALSVALGRHSGGEENVHVRMENVLQELGAVVPVGHLLCPSVSRAQTSCLILRAGSGCCWERVWEGRDEEPQGEAVLIHSPSKSAATMVLRTGTHWLLPWK